MPKTKTTGVLGWIGSTVRNLIDNAAEGRVEPYVARIEAEVTRLKRDFDFGKAAEAVRLEPSDRQLVAKVVYKRFLQRVWRDGQATATESELLDWLAGNLELSRPAAAELNQNAALEVFGATLAKALADGQIAEDERQHLEHIAGAAGGSVAFLMSQFFRNEGEQFIRSLFIDLTANGRLDRDGWKRIRQIAQWLGLPQDQMLKAICHPAKQLIEHTLTDARSDGEISDSEERVIESLLTNLTDDQNFCAYVRSEIAEAKEVQNLARGLLPSVAAPAGIAVRAGEVVHWAGPASFLRERVLASGTRVDATQGTLVITDSRVIMNSSDRPAEVSHRKVLAHHAFGNRIEIRCSGKAAGNYEFPAGPRPIAIWEIAIRRANQTIVASDDKQSRRRIPREVRQRVWQKYGGRCAECSADTYLEFDHIIPVAKGGGNSDINIQLLCRKCNLAKSDNI